MLVVAVVVVTDVVFVTNNVVVAIVVVAIVVVVVVVVVDPTIDKATVVAMTADAMMNAASKDITIHKQEQGQLFLRLNFVNY